MMPAPVRVLCSAAIVVGAAATALADDGPTIVVPNRAVAPIVINGCDASYAVVESDWGLGKNVRLAPTVYGCRAPIVREVGHYFPSGGRVPGYGRLEVEPPANRRLPPQAESYSRSWSAQSAPPAAQPVVPMNPPEVIIAPRDGDPRLRSRF